MTYRDPDSGLEFASYDAYMRERLGENDQQPSDEELCDHSYAGDDSNVGRCYCGLQLYPKGGLRVTSPVSSLATVLAPVREVLESLPYGMSGGHQGRFVDAGEFHDTGISMSRFDHAADCKVCAALAALDSLDGTILLTREEAETIPPEKLRWLAVWLDLDDLHMGRTGDEVQRDLRKWADLLAARIAESEKP